MTTRARRRDALENREALLDAAAAVLRRAPDASIDAIAQEAGLTRRAVYGHFSSREEIRTEVIARGTAHISEALAHVHDDDPARHVAKIGAALWHEIAHVKLAAQILSHGTVDPAVLRGLEPVRRSLRDVIARGAETNLFRHDVSPNMLGTLIETSAITILDVTVDNAVPDDRALRLVITTALGICGLSWAEADAIAEEIA